MRKKKSMIFCQKSAQLSAKIEDFSLRMKLTSGMRIPSYKLLCEYVGDSVLTGSSKSAQLKRWQQKFNFKRDGRSYVIESVYAEPPQTEEESVNANRNLKTFLQDKGFSTQGRCDSSFLGSGEAMLLYILSRQRERYLLLSKYTLCDMFGYIVSDSFPSLAAKESNRQMILSFDDIMKKAVTREKNVGYRRMRGLLHKMREERGIQFRNVFILYKRQKDKDGHSKILGRLANFEEEQIIYGLFSQKKEEKHMSKTSQRLNEDSNNQYVQESKNDICQRIGCDFMDSCILVTASKELCMKQIKYDRLEIARASNKKRCVKSMKEFVQKFQEEHYPKELLTVKRAVIRYVGQGLDKALQEEVSLDNMSFNEQFTFEAQTKVHGFVYPMEDTSIDWEQVVNRPLISFHSVNKESDDGLSSVDFDSALLQESVNDMFNLIQ